MPGVYISERVKRIDPIAPVIASLGAPPPPPPPPPPFTGNSGSFDNWSGTQSFELLGPLAIARTVGE